ncbi:unnamed protein product [Ixodes pacificus]
MYVCARGVGMAVFACARYGTWRTTPSSLRLQVASSSHEALPSFLLSRINTREEEIANCGKRRAFVEGVSPHLPTLQHTIDSH